MRNDVMRVKYSIIVPVYNVASYVAECLDSVLAQGDLSWECIAVDDGSTDGSGAILDAYAAKDSRIKALHKSNGGVSSARNAALDVACGDWIIYLDADDLLAPGALMALQKLESECPDADMLRYGIRVFSDRQGIPPAVSCVEHTIVSDKQKIVDGWCGASFVTYVYSRKKISDLRFKSYAMGEDRLYLAEALLRTNVKGETDFIGYLCRNRPGSAMRSAQTQRKVLDSILWKRDILALFESCGRPIGVAARRRIFLSLTEGAALDIVHLPRHERRMVWKCWFEVLDSAPLSLSPSKWVAFVLGVLKMTHSKMFALVLCAFPQHMKLAGLHR